MDRSCGQTARGTGLLLGRIERPNLQNGFIEKILRYCHQKRAPFYLFDVHDGAGIGGFERSHDLEPGGDDMNEAVSRSKEEVGGAGT